MTLQDEADAAVQIEALSLRSIVGQVTKALAAGAGIVVTAEQTSIAPAGSSIGMVLATGVAAAVLGTIYRACNRSTSARQSPSSPSPRTRREGRRHGRKRDRNAKRRKA